MEASSGRNECLPLLASRGRRIDRISSVVDEFNDSRNGQPSGFKVPQMMGAISSVHCCVVNGGAVEYLGAGWRCHRRRGAAVPKSCEIAEGGEGSGRETPVEGCACRTGTALCRPLSLLDEGLFTTQKKLWTVVVIVMWYKSRGRG